MKLKKTLLNQFFLFNKEVLLLIFNCFFYNLIKDSKYMIKLPLFAD